MRNLLALIGLAVVVLVVVGWYRNWYTVETAAGASHQSVNIEIDRSRINQDIEKGSERLHDALERTRKEAKQAEDVKKEPSKPDPRTW
jgi:hypothetical protein